MQNESPVSCSFSSFIDTHRMYSTNINIGFGKHKKCKAANSRVGDFCSIPPFQIVPETSFFVLVLDYISHRQNYNLINNARAKIILFLLILIQQQDLFTIIFNSVEFLYQLKIFETVNT